MHTEAGTGRALIATIGVLLLAIFESATPSPTHAGDLCVECLQVRVGPPIVVRGPFPDELDAPFSVLRLAGESFRGFSANGVTYAIDGPNLLDMDGPRKAVLSKGAAGSSGECGRWLTSVARTGDEVLGFVHQERSCDYAAGQTDKSMAIATSRDEGLHWTDLGTVISGADSPKSATITGEGDCGMIDGRDGYLYAYCLRNSDWQTIVARAPLGNPSDWHKYFEGTWDEPGLGGRATPIGFIGTGTALLQPGFVAAVAIDPWFNGLRLSLSTDKISFSDLPEPLVPIDGADWNRPAPTGLIAYVSILNSDNGSNAVDSPFLLSYVYVPPGKGFESRYLVMQEVSLTQADAPEGAKVGLALTRWLDPRTHIYVTSTGPLTGDRSSYQRDATVAYMLTRPPEGVANVKLAECSSLMHTEEQMLAIDGTCDSGGYVRDRTAGWLYASEQPGSVPVYACSIVQPKTYFASSSPDCEGFGTQDSLLGYGLAP